jgi:hypothetical protein
MTPIPTQTRNTEKKRKKKKVEAKTNTKHNPTSEHHLQVSQKNNVAQRAVAVGQKQRNRSSLSLLFSPYTTIFVTHSRFNFLHLAVLLSLDLHPTEQQPCLSLSFVLQDQQQQLVLCL